MRVKKAGSLESLDVVRIDIGKDTFHLVGFDRHGQLVLRRLRSVEERAKGPVTAGPF